MIVNNLFIPSQSAKYLMSDIVALPMQSNLIPAITLSLYFYLHLVSKVKITICCQNNVEPKSIK